MFTAAVDGLSTTQAGTKTVLIADDCAEDRDIYRQMLQADPHHHYHILETSTAEKGLDLLQQQNIDVVLLDFCLPDLTGLEFLEELSQLPKATSVPLSVIMLTGYGDETVAVQAIKQGAQDYLVKNHLSEQALQRSVRHAIQQADLQTQLHRIHERQHLIAQIALRFRESSNLEEILQIAATEVQELLGCERVQILPVATTHKPNLLTGTPQTLNTPIVLHQSGEQTGSLWGWLIVDHSQEKSAGRPDAQELLQDLVVHLAIAIQQAELLISTQAALARERELNMLKSRIISTVSHEYRTPLSVILTSASVLLKHSGQLTSEQQQRYLHFIEDKARHLTRLVDDMLVLERCELDKAQFHPTSLDLPQLLANVLEQQRQRADETYQFNLKVSGRISTFWGDQGMLHLVLMNLLDNAIKYSPEGGKIDVSLTNQTHQVILAIKDQGIGIPTADQARLFQSFSRGTNVETIPGTGLGLAIVKACVDLHHGTVKVNSQVGKGTIIQISMPRQPQLAVTNTATIATTLAGTTPDPLSELANVI
jgi:signal transduction histidine kinase